MTTETTKLQPQELVDWLRSIIADGYDDSEGDHEVIMEAIGFIMEHSNAA